MKLYTKSNLLKTAVSIALLTTGSAYAGGFTADLNRDGLVDTNQIIIKYSDNKVNQNELKAVSQRTGINLGLLRSMHNQAKVLKLEKHLSQEDFSKVLAELNALSNVEYAEADAYMYPLFTPNDPGYDPEQWHYYDAVAGMNAPAAWDLSTGVGVNVAVIDTGYRPHIDLAANIIGGYDMISDPFTGNDGDGRDSDALDPGDWVSSFTECGFFAFPSDSSWHGTHVAGTIAAVTDNNTGVAGVAYNAKVVPVRGLGKCGGTTSDIADAVVWSSGGNVAGVPTNANPAQVINMSLGGGGACGSTMQSAVNTARSNGTVVVVAAGNSSADVSGFSPASCDGVIAVAASGGQAELASYSNFGSLIDITAPGGGNSPDGTLNGGILSTLNDGTTTPGNDAYAYYQGTSMASPHVAGVAALMLSVNPDLTPDEVESLIKSSARDFVSGSGCTTANCGAGMLDAAAAVAAAGGEPPPPPEPGPPTASFSSDCNELDCSFDASASSDVSGGTIVSYAWTYGDGASGNGVTSSHSYASAGTYTVTLTVTDNDGETDSSSQSVTVDTAPPPPAGPPNAPSNLNADVVKEGKGKKATIISVDLSWTDNSDNETSFEIERCIETGKGKNKTCNFSTYASVGADVTSFSDPSPASNAKYRVRAVNAEGASSYSNEVEP